MQVASMVRSLSNKYFPVPLLNEVEIDLLQSLKDFCHRAWKQATAVTLQETNQQPKEQQTQCTTDPNISTTLNNDSWHEPPIPAENNNNWYGLGINL